MAPMGAALRASSTLIDQAERSGQLVTSTGIGFVTVFLFFCILQITLNAFSLALGYFGGHPIVEALAGAQRKTRRLAARLRSTGRAEAKAEAALGGAYSLARAWIRELQGDCPQDLAAASHECARVPRRHRGRLRRRRDEGRHEPGCTTSMRSTLRRRPGSKRI